MWRSARPALLALVLTGCAVGPSYERPALELPETWRIELDHAEAAIDTAWWRAFDDPALDALIDQAVARNLDLAVALERVREFAARVGITASGRWPQLGYDASAARARLSRETGIGALGGSRTADSFEANLNVSWELDLWGRIARAEDAAEADFLAVEENRRALVLALVTAVAETYIELRGLDAQLQVAKASLDSRRQSLELFELQLERGVLSELEVAQLRSEFERTAATLPALERAIALTENALSVLLGRPPGAIPRGRALTELTGPPIPAGLPATLLERRPDLRAAEQQLVAATARIGVARAERFPRIALTGLFGLASSELSRLAESSAEQAALAAGLSGPLFTAGRVRGGIEAAEAAAAQADLRYRAAVLTALREAEDALVVHATTRTERDAQLRRVAALRDYRRFAVMRYDTGYTSYLAVLDAERSLFDGELQALRTAADALRALIGLYKALGGGWIDRALAPPADGEATPE
ncbi:efflux transporter outer membrane subunit [Wenzhouxiangella sp. XN79A]|uniref:efflux transporter outer membrane subunit n=1 Tax=Wenzhouxiangella sp. XN79A TaxID=2724193 RepID=UPI00144A4FC3|nr:efflux transporter outer membrane subunit [Wenzhouxiangella sp. XN79A]NKI34271.1 efflux transporter outer membrane subunit [Wenzhouxiangella sp. XN79A]